MTALPTYNQAITNFKPPPTYQDVISTDPYLLPNEFSCHDFYFVDTLTFMNINEEIDLFDDDFKINLNYDIKTNSEINDLKICIILTLNEKLIQLNRNKLFIAKKIKSNDSSNYFINQLRVSTLKDFNRIELKLINQLNSINDLIKNYKFYNKCYYILLNELLNTELINNHKLINKLNKCCYNLNQISNQIKKFTNSDDISYVLKERARVYNEAKQVILNRQRC